MPAVRTTPATMPSAAPRSSAWCATAGATAIWPPRSGPAHSAGSAARPRARAMNRPRSRCSGRSRLARGAGLGEQLLQLAALVHLERDVAAADELALDVKLRVGRPVGEALEGLAHLRLLEDIDMFELGADCAQRGDRLRRKPAL